MLALTGDDSPIVDLQTWGLEARDCTGLNVLLPEHGRLTADNEQLQFDQDTRWSLVAAELDRP